MVERNINEGLPWSPIDLLDLYVSFRRVDPIYDIADFLCRSEREVRAKAIELGLMKPLIIDAIEAIDGIQLRRPSPTRCPH